jgi:SHS2 domain-containing protein
MKTIDYQRRIRLDLMTPAELAIYNAMLEVEKIGADKRLTEAVIKLQDARTLVADFIDGVNSIGTY